MKITYLTVLVSIMLVVTVAGCTAGDVLSDVVEKGDKVKVDYTGKLENGEIFDSSVGKVPLDFVVGAGQMIAGFDAGVLGMKVGEKKELTLQPKDAYGEYDPTKIQAIDRAEIENFLAKFNVKPSVGLDMTRYGAPFTITKMDATHIFLDMNHKLAGKTLIFEVELVDLVKSSSSE